MYLEREDSYTCQVCRGYKIWILNFKEEGLGLLYRNFLFKVFLSCFSFLDYLIVYLYTLKSGALSHIYVHPWTQGSDSYTTINVYQNQI